MRTLRVALFAATAFMFNAVSSEAALITLDFDELATGTVLDTEYAADGVTFLNSDGSLLVSTATPGAPFTAPRAILPSNYFPVGNYNQATFSVPVSFVSVVMGDFASDADNLFLTAYDAGNNVIATDTDFLAASVSGGLQLSVAASNIAYVRFYGVGSANNSVYFDNFVFDTATRTAPEPTMLVLLGTGIIAGGARRWRRRR